jgi:hypothetical protein
MYDGSRLHDAAPAPGCIADHAMMASSLVTDRTRGIRQSGIVSQPRCAGLRKHVEHQLRDRRYADSVIHHSGAR